MKHTIVAFMSSAAGNWMLCLSFFFFLTLFKLIWCHNRMMLVKTWTHGAGRLHGWAAHLQHVAASIIGINTTSTDAVPQWVWWLSTLFVCVIVWSHIRTWIFCAFIHSRETFITFGNTSESRWFLILLLSSHSAASFSTWWAGLRATSPSFNSRFGRPSVATFFARWYLPAAGAKSKDWYWEMGVCEQLNLHNAHTTVVRLLLRVLETPYYQQVFCLCFQMPNTLLRTRWARNEGLSIHRSSIHQSNRTIIEGTW